MNRDDSHLPLSERYDTNPRKVELARINIANAAYDQTTPHVEDVMALKLAEPMPWYCPSVVVTGVTITDGRPEHGALRSEDHVSKFEAIIPKECDECGHDYATFEYSANHHIAGHYHVTCRSCNTEHERESWG